MVRSTSPLVLLLTLALGISLGLNFQQNPRTVSAQARPPIPIASPTEDVGPPPTSSGIRGAGEDGLYGQLARQYAQFEHVNRTFELVARAISPSVVHLVAHKSGKRDDDPYGADYEETGSGVIVRDEVSKGLFVLTNNHVVAGAIAGQIDVFLSDGRSCHPSKMYLDSKADIAVLKLDRTDLPAARLGNSDETPVGSWVLAMGSPFGLNHSVSQGIISGRGRHEVDLEKAGVENQDFLQTDAAINPGNSGGPLVNMKGEVVGINIAILSNGGGNEGVGFSIPINLAKWIMGQLLSHNGHVFRGALGVKLHPDFEPETALALGLDRPRGAWIESVDHQSPAAAGGLKEGDVVLRFNGVDVADLNHLINLVSMAPIGQPADLVIWRDRREVPMKITVADKERIVARSVRPTRPPAGSVMGLELVTLDAPVARRMGLPEGFRGAAVMKVEPDSPLATVFRPLDVIHDVSGRPIQSADEVVQALGARRASTGLELGIHRLIDGAFQRSRVRVP
ncbi:trypsin-like peptidase domain-containing protein [Tundrisphaera lichenicola]|uniref:trypsin-like peptidase domain-containing protein n=1 Tax=Tundrisphaera lichenicola TaxID=2029860 RepID=UPI003EBD5716